MEDRSTNRHNNPKLDLLNMSEVKRVDSFDEQQDLKNLLVSLNRRR